LATLNVNIPRFYCFLRKEFLYDGLSHHGESVNVCVFGAASIKGHALGFHALTDNGAVIWRLPLHAFCHKADAPPAPLDWLQFWDCFSYEMACTTFDRLQDARVRVQIWKVERETETTQAYFYDPVGSAPRSAQVALYAKGLRADDEPVLKPNLKIKAKGA
jgi:hypothetical protein